MKMIQSILFVQIRYQTITPFKIFFKMIKKKINENIKKKIFDKQN